MARHVLNSVEAKGGYTKYCLNTSYFLILGNKTIPMFVCTDHVIVLLKMEVVSMVI